MKRFSIAIAAMMLAACATTDSGVVRQSSDFSVSETVDRLTQVLESKGLTVFATVDHAAGAAKVGETLRATTLVMFGNPKAGTPVMQCQQEAGLDLPQKALIYENAEGEVWLLYNDPAYLARRHSIVGCEAPLDRISGALAGLTAAALSAKPK